MVVVYFIAFAVAAVPLSLALTRLAEWLERPICPCCLGRGKRHRMRSVGGRAWDCERCGFLRRAA